nr:MAG: coiled-coil domain-containing protein [Bacteriophage sp.]
MEDRDIDFEHRLTEIEARAKSNTKRLDEHDQEIKENNNLIGAIKELATEVKYMRADLNDTIERLNKLEGKDVNKWEKFKWLLVAGLVTIVLGSLAVQVGLK